jgi:hypothetical protein
LVFELVWLETANQKYEELEAAAKHSLDNREKNKKAKASPIEGLFKQVDKCIELLKNNPRHPGLKTHEFDALTHPYDPKKKVFEAYAQNKTPGAYRVFWCYGPGPNQITIIAISPHP